MNDEYTMEMRMCDDDGMVSHTPIEEKRDIPLLDPNLTYLDRLNWLRNLTLRSRSEENDTIEEPFACTGHAHLAGEHIRCTSKAHCYSHPKIAWDKDWDEMSPEERKHMVALAKVGTMALVDEATTYQEERDPNELREIFENQMEKDR